MFVDTSQGRNDIQVPKTTINNASNASGIVPAIPGPSTSAPVHDSSDKENQPAKRAKAVKDGASIFRPSKTSMSAR